MYVISHCLLYHVLSMCLSRLRDVARLAWRRQPQQALRSKRLQKGRAPRSRRARRVRAARGGAGAAFGEFPRLWGFEISHAYMF